jgi:hypothetical protein
MLCLNDASEAEYANTLIREALDAVNPQPLPSAHRNEFMDALLFALGCTRRSWLASAKILTS